MTFNDLDLIEPILRAVKKEQYTEPSPIQAEAIPLLLTGRDMLGCAQTGTGKTAAFALPILQMLYNEKSTETKKPQIKTLVLTPTRELAAQVAQSFTVYGQFTGLKTAVIFGGVGQASQVNALRKGVDILVATPGRLNDLVGQGECDLSHVTKFVLDEADRMLDMGFIHDVKKVIALIPTERQTLLFSATMPKEIADLAASILRDPARVSVTPVSSTVEIIRQTVYFVDRYNKRSLLNHVLENAEITSALVFSRTKHGAERISRNLKREGISADAIHGDKSQAARQYALDCFKSGRIRVLVATDIAARGIDIHHLSHVINVDLPNEPETYVHRIGRTGRAGFSGEAISFCEFEEKPYLEKIQKLTGKEVTVIEDHPYPMQLFEKTPVQPRVRPLREKVPGAAPRGERAERTKPFREMSSEESTPEGEDSSFKAALFGEGDESSDAPQSATGGSFERRSYGKPREDRSDRPRREGYGETRREGGDRPRREGGDRPRSNGYSGPRREGGDRPQRRDDDRPRREYSDRPKRDFSDKPRREFSDRPKREFSDRPRGDQSEKPGRDFGDRLRSNGYDRPRNGGSDRPRGEGYSATRHEGGDRPQRRDDDRPRREYSDRPKRDFSDKPRREGGDRPHRDFSDKPRRDFSNAPRGNRSEKPQRDGWNKTPRDNRDRPNRENSDRPRRDFSDKPRGNRSEGNRQGENRRQQRENGRRFEGNGSKPHRGNAGSGRPSAPRNHRSGPPNRHPPENRGRDN